MKEFKTSRRYAQITLRDSLHNISTYIILAILFLVAQYYCPEIGSYLKETGAFELVGAVYLVYVHQTAQLFVSGRVVVVAADRKTHGGTAVLAG